MTLTPEKFWLAVGFLAQGIFAARFIIQWIASERAGRSYVPVAFWLVSLAGGIMLTAYAIYRLDPVFIVGQGTGIIVYVRNLMLVHKERKAPAQAPSSNRQDAKPAKNGSGT
jgi:lipid-A-disaccharide synthase-like uncharacterized protein